MGYIDKNNNTFMYNSLEFGYLKNKDGKATNPALSVSFNLNVITNETAKPTYTVRCFDSKETFGFTYESFDNYVDAKECYDNLFTKYHVN